MIDGCVDVLGWPQERRLIQRSELLEMGGISDEDEGNGAYKDPSEVSPGGSSPPLGDMP